MSATKQATPASILPQVTITYHKEGEHFHFDVTKEGVTRKLTYHDPSKGWTCDCEQFADDTCLHVELVKLWRAQQKNGSQAAPGSNGKTPPPPPGNGDAPPPRSVSNGNGNGAAAAESTSPPAPPARPGHRKGRKPATAAPTSAFPTPATGVSAWDKTVAEALLAPFPADMVGWKAQATTKDNSRAMAVAYIDARCVMDRLDETVGPENWSDSYSVLGDQTGSFGKEVVVECRLTVLSVTKCDVGVGEDGKSAYSDAFKRAAVKLGIGRYLYSLDKQWVGFDAKSKQLSEQPQLPAWAIPA
jgi:hypothetical protein